MRDEAKIDFESDASMKTGAWNAYDVWKTTIHEPRCERAERGDRSLGDRLDAEEDRMRLRVRAARRVAAVLLLAAASALAIMGDHYLSTVFLSASHAQRQTQGALTPNS